MNYLLFNYDYISLIFFFFFFSEHVSNSDSGLSDIMSSLFRLLDNRQKLV